MNYKTVKITNKDLEIAYEFADARSKDIKLYQKRGSFKLSDITTGALAELAVYKVLKKAGFNVCKPDFEIYDKSKKSFKADMTDGKRHFHVKGQQRHSAEIYGCSWLMQRTDPIINRPEKGHYMIPCVVDEENMEVFIYGCIPLISLVNENCVGECTVPSFRRTKVALYLHDIATNLTTSRRWGILHGRTDYED